MNVEPKETNDQENKDLKRANICVYIYERSKECNDFGIKIKKYNKNNVLNKLCSATLIELPTVIDFVKKKPW